MNYDVIAYILLLKLSLNKYYTLCNALYYENIIIITYKLIISVT